MVISPAVVESEEVIRQAVPARMGFANISAGNLIGTVLYFTLIRTQETDKVDIVNPCYPGRFAWRG
jgi:hypothetical protein